MARYAAPAAGFAAALIVFVLLVAVAAAADHRPVE